MALNIDVKFEGKLACAFKIVMRNLADFDQTKFEKLGLLLGLFIQNRKCMTLKFKGELCVMTMKNNTKFEEELTCQFQINMSNLTNFDMCT